MYIQEQPRGSISSDMLLQVYKIYLRWLTGTISWWKPPEGTVFNIPLFTGWEQALAGKIPMSWWKRVTFQALIRFNKWLYPRPELFKWLNVGHSLRGHALSIIMLAKDEGQTADQPGVAGRDRYLISRGSSRRVKDLLPSA